MNRRRELDHRIKTWVDHAVDVILGAGLFVLIVSIITLAAEFWSLA